MPACIRRGKKGLTFTTNDALRFSYLREVVKRCIERLSRMPSYIFLTDGGRKKGLNEKKKNIKNRLALAHEEIWPRRDFL